MVQAVGPNLACGSISTQNCRSWLVKGLIGIIQRTIATPEQVSEGTIQTVAETGVFQNASNTGFQEGYYPLPGELESLFTEMDWEILDVLSLKSIASGMAGQISQLNETMRRKIEKVATGLERQSEVISMCGHVIIVFHALS